MAKISSLCSWIPCTTCASKTQNVMPYVMLNLFLSGLDPLPWGGGGVHTHLYSHRATPLPHCVTLSPPGFAHGATVGHYLQVSHGTCPAETLCLCSTTYTPTPPAPHTSSDFTDHSSATLHSLYPGIPTSTVLHTPPPPTRPLHRHMCCTTCVQS